MIGLDNLIGAIYQAVLTAGDALAKKNLEVLDTYFENAEEDNLSNLRPKTVIIQYPQVTAKGVKVHDVHVPLIALVPLSMTKISEVKLKTKFEISLEKDVLRVGFPTKDASSSGEYKEKEGDYLFESGSAILEITLCPSIPPDGLKKLIEGYEKTLRAQIPG